MARPMSVVLGALMLAQACCTSAVPLSSSAPKQEDTALEDRATTYSLAGQSDKNGYMLAMSSLRKMVRHTGCNTSFNGQPISPHYCTADFIRFSTPECTCDQHLVLTVDQKVHGKVVGAELALYKLPEKYDAENILHYKVSIHYEDLQARPLLVHRIPASSSGWQVFHFELPYNTHWPNTQFNLILSISATGPRGDTLLSCSEVFALFILNSKKMDSTSGTGVVIKDQLLNPTPYLPMFVTFLESSSECANPPCAIALKRQRRGVSILNNYIRNFYYQFVAIKVSNCTKPLLGQSVSYNLCRSNKVVFVPVEAPATSPPQNSSYKLCSNVSPPSTTEEILGRDLIIYKRPLLTQNVTLEVFLIEVISVDPQWQKLIANSTVQTNASGWQVFHIDSYTNVTGTDRICVDVYVRVQENITFLSKEELMEMFILDSYDPGESDKTPLLTTFVYKRRGSYSLFRKRRLLQNYAPFPVEENTAACLLQDRIVNLSEYLQMTVLYPEVANLGKCIGNNFMQQARGMENEQKNTAEVLHTSRCVPTKLEDLHVLVSEGDYISVIALPKIVTTDCGWSTYKTY